jgi:hypothetical protein
MNYLPFEHLDNIELTVREAEIKLRIGLPCTVRNNEADLIEYDFDKYIFRFDMEGNLSEVTANCKVLEYKSQKITFKELSKFISVNDIQAFEKYGFIVSPKYGVAFDPEFEPWVTFLTHSGLSGWKNV